VERPALVRSLWHRHRCPCPKGSLAATATANLQALLPVEPSQLLVVQADALPVEQDVQAPIAEAPALGRHLPQPVPDRPVVGTHTSIAHRSPVRSDRRARPALAHPMRVAEMSHGLPSGGGRYHFFEAISFSIVLDRKSTRLNSSHVKISYAV